MNVIGVASKDIGRIEEKLLPFLRLVEGGGRFPAEHILEDLKAGQRQCWVAVEGSTIHAVAITKVYTLEGRDICEISQLAGEGFEEWNSAVEEIAAWAKHIGCAEIEATGRPGFRKLLKQHGFKETHVIFRRALNAW